MVGYFIFSSLHKTQKNLFDSGLISGFYLILHLWRSAVQSLILVEIVAIRKKIMIKKNLIVENLKNVIHMDSFCSTGDLNTNQGGALKQDLVLSSPCLQKPEFQMNFQRKVNRVSVNAGCYDSLESLRVYIKIFLLFAKLMLKRSVKTLLGNKYYKYHIAGWRERYCLCYRGNGSFFWTGHPQSPASPFLGGKVWQVVN